MVGVWFVGPTYFKSRLDYIKLLVRLLLSIPNLSPTKTICISMAPVRSHDTTGASPPEIGVFPPSDSALF